MDLYVFWCTILFFFKQKTAYEMRISDWSSDVCSSDLMDAEPQFARAGIEAQVFARRHRRPARRPAPAHLFAHGALPRKVEFGKGRMRRPAGFHLGQEQCDFGVEHRGHSPSTGSHLRSEEHTLNSSH